MFTDDRNWVTVTVPCQFSFHFSFYREQIPLLLLGAKNIRNVTKAQ